MRLQPAQIDIAQGRLLALENPDCAVRERDSAGLGAVEVDLVDDAVAEFDVSELRPAQIEIGDAAVLEQDSLPHAVVDDSGADPGPGDLGVVEAASRHRPRIGPAALDTCTCEADSGEVHRRLGLAEVHPSQRTVEEGGLGRVDLCEVEVGEVHVLVESFGLEVPQAAGSQAAEVQLRWARGLSGHGPTVSGAGVIALWCLGSTITVKVRCQPPWEAA